MWAIDAYRGRRRQRARHSDQHGHAALLLRPRRRDPARRGDRATSRRPSSTPTGSAGRRSSSATSRRSTPRSPPSPASTIPSDGDVATDASTAPCPPTRRTSSPGSRPDDGRRRRPPAGVGAPRRRHVPDRDGTVREASDRPGDPDLGPRHLHRLRQVRDRLPARHDPHEGVRAVGPRRCAAVVQVEGVPLQGHRRLSDDDPGGPRRLHRLRGVRRRVPGEVEDRGAPQVDQHGTGADPPRGGAAGVGLLPVDPRARSRPPAPRFGQGLAGVAAAVRVLRSLRRLRRDALHQAGDAAVRRPDGRRQRHRLLVDLRRQPADHTVDGQRRRPRPGVEQLAVRGQRRVRSRPASRPRSADVPRHPPARTARRRGRRRTRRRDPVAPTRSPRPASAPSASASPRCATPSNRCSRRMATPAPPPATCWRWPAA